MTPQELTRELKREAARQGFRAAGVCRAQAAPGVDRFHEWLARGYAGQMQYLSERAEAYHHPRSILDGVRSLLLLALDYRTAEPRRPHRGQGRVARYAWGSLDYHDLIHGRLKRLRERLLELAPGARVRGVVDTAPLLEREFAQLAGLGWVGKNTLLLTPEAGSWFFLAALLTDATLEVDAPHATDHCGTCTACLDACPTQAFPQPYVLDATRCISYLTIEHRTHVAPALREGIGDWLFGCDICQEVCPWNRRAPRSDEPELAPRDDMNPVDLASLFALDDDAFRARFRRTPLWRAKRRGLLRNAAIVLGNQGAPESVEPLGRGLRDPDALVRAACAWALGRIDSTQARQSLRTQALAEQDLLVREEIQAALAPHDR